MPRAKRLTVSAINIVTHPHNAENYVILLNAAFELKVAVPTQGDQRMLMSYLDSSRVDKEGLIYGSIARFTELDPNLPWFDSDKLTVAEETDVKSIQIPKTLKPNYISIRFVFFVKEHTFVFEQKVGSISISPHIMARYIGALLLDTKLAARFGPVEVTLVSDRAKLSEIFGIPVLRRVRIMIRRPNPDDLGDYDAEIEKRLERIKATKAEFIYSTDREQSLVPDDTTKALAEVATRNGQVDSGGSDEDGGPIHRSSEQYPLKLVHSVAEAGPISQASFTAAAHRIIAAIRSKE